MECFVKNSAASLGLPLMSRKSKSKRMDVGKKLAGTAKRDQEFFGNFFSALAVFFKRPLAVVKGDVVKGDGAY